MPKPLTVNLKRNSVGLNKVFDDFLVVVYFGVG